ncbi:MAG: type II secretion system protein [Planctomycetaceae bacterium]|nr:type II secretion system protein [Planctomycetaceae bacterium]
MKTRKGFTLIELVVVVMIIGILVAIAAPKMLNITGEATDSSVRMSLNVVRDAIETYASQNAGVYPTAASDTAFKEALKPYLRGVFPKSLVGTKDSTVTMSTDDPLAANGSSGWMYNGTTGEFILNCTDPSKDGTTTYAQF